MLALVMPGWLLRAGLLLLTCRGTLAFFALSLYMHQARTNLARVPRLLLQLPNCGLLRRFALVNQTSRELDAERLYGRAVLHDDHRADRLAGVLENGHDGDGIDTS